VSEKYETLSKILFTTKTHYKHVYNANGRVSANIGPLFFASLYRLQVLFFARNIDQLCICNHTILYAVNCTDEIGLN